MKNGGSEFNLATTWPNGRVGGQVGEKWPGWRNRSRNRPINLAKQPGHAQPGHCTRLPIRSIGGCRVWPGWNKLRNRPGSLPEPYPANLPDGIDFSLSLQGGQDVFGRSGGAIGVKPYVVFGERAPTRKYEISSPFRYSRSVFRIRLSLDALPNGNPAMADRRRDRHSKSKACDARPIAFFAPVAGPARSHKIFCVIRPSLDGWLDVIDFELDVRRVLSAVATGEVVPQQNLPPSAVPVSLDDSSITHVRIIADSLRGCGVADLPEAAS